jgi:hypothetical protein
LEQIYLVILRDILAHLTSIGVSCGVVLIALIHTMPAEPPTSFRQMWSWFRDTLQTAIPASRSNPTPPAGPAQEKKS